MSTIEDRLVRDIATATRGVVVTDSDLRDARAEIDARIGRSQQNRRRNLVAVAAAAVIVLVLGVAGFLTLDAETKTAPPASNVPTPSPTFDNHASFLTGGSPTDKDLQAVWRLDNGDVLMRFAPPNLVSLDHDGRLFDNPGVQGTYTLQGEMINITVDGGPYGCGGAQIVMRGSVPEEGRLRFVIAEQGEGACAGLRDQRLVMERVLPLAVYQDWHGSEEKGWLPVTDEDTLFGTYFAEGGRYLLELDRGHQYHVASGTGEQVDYGEWTLQRGKLTLTSWPDSVRCSTNDQLVTDKVEYTHPGTTVLRFDVQRNDCGGGWTPKSWVLVPYRGS